MKKGYKIGLLVSKHWILLATFSGGMEMTEMTVEEELVATKEVIQAILDGHGLTCQVMTTGPGLDVFTVMVTGLKTDDDQASLRRKMGSHVPNETTILSGDDHSLIFEGGGLSELSSGFQRAFAG